MKPAEKLENASEDVKEVLVEVDDLEIKFRLYEALYSLLEVSQDID